MAELCSVCECDVAKCTLKAKRLKLYGDVNKDSRERLELFLYQEFGISLQTTPLAAAAWLCHKCKKDSYFELIKEINAKRDNLLDNLKRIVAVTAVHSRKRPSSEDNSSTVSQHTTPKRPKAATSFMKVRLYNSLHALIEHKSFFYR